MIIYVDVLLAVNFIVNFLLLRITALLCRKRPTLFRLTLGAAIGAVGSLSIFLPPMPRLCGIIYRAALTAAVTAAVFCRCKPMVFVSAMIKLLLSSMLLCGALSLWQFCFSPVGFIQKNGVIYFDIGAFALIFCCVLGYIAASLLSRVMSAVPNRQLCTVSIFENGSSCVFTALVDTGSSLKEPFSGLPAAVCERAAVSRVIPDGFDELLSGKTVSGRIRLIPYRAVGISGVLPAFLPERVVFTTEDGESCEAACYIAVTEQSFEGGWGGICNPAVFLSKSCLRGNSYAQKNS